MIKFRDDKHKQDFETVMQRMNADSQDVYRAALAYLITADNACAAHVDKIYDFNERCIIPDCLADSWQTDTSGKTCRLAFNLFNGGLGWCEEEERSLVTPANLFCSTLAPFYWEAVKLRYPEYTK